MTHIAIQEQLDGKMVNWMDKVSDEQWKKRFFYFCSISPTCTPTPTPAPCEDVEDEPASAEGTEKETIQFNAVNSPTGEDETTGEDFEQPDDYGAIACF